MAEKLGGVFTALLTPFAADGSVDYKALKKLVRFNLDKGVSGFYVGGSTSEAFLLSSDERKNILETVVEETNKEANIIAHIGCVGEDHALDLARHAKETGVDAVSSVPPFYYGFSYDEIRNYYFDIADVGVPVIIYNFVAAGGAKLSTDNFRDFLSDKRFIGVKHTSSDFFMLERLKAFREDAVVFNGFDEMFISGLAAGADGGIGSTYNFMAEKFIKIEKLFRENKLAEAFAEQRKANNIIEVLCKFGVMPSEKVLCKYLGVDLGTCRKPFKKLTAEEEEILISVYKENV
ncbi:MAG: N-acetylneuraminate lyase [Clostridia bacterium]|nr:N-acetylneuraminate lyase [Clostridia bacterium]